MNIEKGRDYTATVKDTGLTVKVYRTNRGTWCNSLNCKTEYKDEELSFKAN